MAKQDEISSTERLLELIRTENKEEIADSGRSPKRKSGRLKSIFSNTVSFKKNVTVGVDIGYDDLKMVKLQRV